MGPAFGVRSGANPFRRDVDKHVAHKSVLHAANHLRPDVDPMQSVHRADFPQCALRESITVISTIETAPEYLHAL